MYNSLVRYTPKQCFELKTDSDRCIACGFSETGTNYSGENEGYCKTCGNRREKLVDEIVGNIDISENSVELKILEELRISMTKERIYHLINKACLEKSQEDPLSKEDFIYLEKFYIEKLRVIIEMKEIIDNAIKLIKVEEKKQKRCTVFLYKKYLEDLDAMYGGYVVFREEKLTQYRNQYQTLVYSKSDK